MNSIAMRAQGDRELLNKHAFRRLGYAPLKGISPASCAR